MEGQTVLSIKVDSSQAIQSIAEYTRKIEECRKAEAELQKIIRKEGDATGELRNQLAAIGEERKTYSRLVQEQSKEVQNNIKEQTKEVGSLNQLRAQLSKLTKEYDELSRAERNSAKGEELKKHINEITDELKGGEEATQRYYRNVGNYAGALQGLFGSAASGAATTATGIASLVKASGGAIPALKAVGTAATTALGPIGIAVLAIVGAFTAMKKVISSSEDLTQQSTETFAGFKAIFEALKNVLQIVVGWVLKYVQAVMAVNAAIAEGIGKVLAWLGIDAVDKAIQKNKEYVESVKAIEREKNKLAKDERKLNEQNADSELKVAKLKAELASKNKYTAQERLKMLAEANAEEEKMAKESFDIARRKYEVLQKEGELSQNTAEANEKLSQSYVAMRQAEMAYFNKVKELRAQEVEAQNQIKAEQAAAISKWKELRQGSLTAAQKVADLEIELMDEGIAKEKALENLRYERQVQELKAIKATAQGKKDINKALELAEELHRKKMLEIADNYLNESFARIREEREKLLAMQDDLDNTILQQQKEVDAELLKFTQEFERDKALARKNAIAEARLNGQDTLALELEQKKAELDAIQQLEGESWEQFRARQLAAEQAYRDAQQKVRQANIQKVQAEMNVVGGLMNSLSQIVDAFSEDSREAAIAAKAIALGEIAVKTGVAIAGGVAQAQSVPFPANLAAIGTTVATVIGNVATALQMVKSAKFSTGGYVSGEGSGTSDSIHARLSNGESVLNARATSMFAPILSPLNQMGGGVPIIAGQTANQVQGEDMLARAFAKGMADADIRVGVDEITRVQNRVKVVENIGVL